MIKRKFIPIYLIIFIIGILSTFYYSPVNHNKLNFLHRFMVDRAYAKWTDHLSNIPMESRVLIEYDSLFSIISFPEKRIIEEIFALNPSELGFKGPFQSLDSPKNLIRIPETQVGEGKMKKNLGIQFLPEQVYNAYYNMNRQMESEIGKILYVNSGYRSPGRQAYGFLDELTLTSINYSLINAAKWVAYPGYSEHGNPKFTAIDFINSEGISGEEPNQDAEDFENTIEYKWLIKNANKFGFYLTYPRNNPYGISFESWHWHWEGDLTEYMIDF